jgi:hypothetical protein
MKLIKNSRESYKGVRFGGRDVRKSERDELD